MLDEFLAVQAESKGPGTDGWWERVIPELSAEKSEALMAAGRNRDISHRTISVVLGRWGFRVSPEMVGHWRRNHVV